jgi:cytochrome b561
MSERLVTRYHPLLVALHWLLAVLIIGALLYGYFVLAPMPDEAPGKVPTLRLHMIGGVSILALTIVRLVIRMTTARPPVAQSGHPPLDRIAQFIHAGFYLLIVAMAATGLATAVLSGLNLIVFGNSTAPFPTNLDDYPTLIAHQWIARLLVGLISLHVAAALYHQFVRKDGLLRRMAFGARD